PRVRTTTPNTCLLLIATPLVLTLRPPGGPQRGYTDVSTLAGGVAAWRQANGMSRPFRWTEPRRPRHDDRGFQRVAACNEKPCGAIILEQYDGTLSSYKTGRVSDAFP